MIAQARAARYLFPTLAVIGLLLAAAPGFAADQPAASALPVRASDHGTYDRLVFDWPKPVTYTAAQKGDQLTLTFARGAEIDIAALRRELPADVTVASITPSGDSTTIVLGIPANAKIHHFTEGARIVVDVQRSGDAATKALAAAAQPAAPSGPPAATGTSKPAIPAATPAAPEPAKPAATAAAAPRPAAAPTPAPAPATAPATPATPQPAATTAAASTPPPVVPGSTSTVKPPAPVQTFSISVSWDQPVGAAIFQRAGYLWLVFDKHQDVDVKLLRRLGGDAVTFAEQLPSKVTTILRLIVQPDYKPSVRQDGLLWVVDLTGEATEPSAPIEVQAPVNLPTGTGMALSVKEPRSVIDFIDPEVGDTIVVVPVAAVGEGVYPGRDSPDLQLLATFQGIAIVPHIDAIDVKTSRAGVTIGIPGGANVLLSTTPTAQTTAATPGAGLFDVSAWKGTGDQDFNKAAKQVADSLVDLSSSQEGMANLHAAEFYFGNGYSAECLGFLRLALAAEPTMADTPQFRALRGACSYMMGRWQDAQADLDNPLLKDDGESQFWRAAAHASALPQPAEWDKPLTAGLPYVRNYPKALKWPLSEITAKSALAAGDDATARDAIALMADLAKRGDEKAEVGYLTGALEEMKGQFDRALANYDHAKTGDSREFRARAGLAQAELLLRTHKIKAKDAAERLDKLRFAWREGDFEFNLLKRLAELQTEAEEYPEALRTLRTLANNYSDNAGVGAVRVAMSDTFNKLYLSGAADSLSPVAAIGLYDEFRDLTPAGQQGDDMIRKLADRLVKVDLLDRAGALLKYQVTYRLKGLDKARVGSQLALLDLLDKRPNDALDALSSSNVEGLPPELVDLRRHLQARALADLDRTADAITALKDDQSIEGGMLRAEVYWRAKDWPNAADAFAALVPEPERGSTLDLPHAQIVMNWATALSLGKDDRGLATLRRVYGPSMAGTSFAAAFDLLTSAPDKQISNFPGLADKIKQAQAFKTFIASYKDKVQAQGLSSIN